MYQHDESEFLSVGVIVDRAGSVIPGMLAIYTAAPSCTHTSPLSGRMDALSLPPIPSSSRLE